MALEIKTNNVPRPVIDAFELTEEEQKDFDYLDWTAIKAGEFNPQFFRYKGQLYDLGEFMLCPSTDWFKGWSGYYSDSAFSGILVKYRNDFQDVIIGQYFS